MTTPEYRLLVQQDDDPDGPIGWGRVTVVSRAGYVRSGGSDPIGLARAVELLEDHFSDRDTVSETAIRWARIFHGVEVKEWHPRGYTQSDWGIGLAYLEDEAERADPNTKVILDGMIETLDAWFRGDVYGVTLQRSVTWVRTDRNPHEDGATMTTWEDVDSLWGNYLQQGYTARNVAEENFAPQGDAVSVRWDDVPIVTP